MTRNLSTALAAHFAGELTTLAMCWLLTRTDGTIMGFTDHSVDMVVDGITYHASTAFAPSSIQSNSNFSVDNLELDGILDSASITEPDLMAGVYDYAAVEIFLVNYANLSHGKLILRTGTLGEVSIQKEQFVAEIRGISQQIQQNIGRLFTPTCSAILGDTKCTLNLTPFTFSGTVSSVVDNQTFTAMALTQASDYFTGGIVQWVTGLNTGLSMEIKEFSDKQAVCSLAMPRTIQVGDTFTIVAGCNKTFATCKAKFNNVVNFRGFPAIPGMDQMFTTSGTRS